MALAGRPVVAALAGRPVVATGRCGKLAGIVSFSFCSTCKACMV